MACLESLKEDYEHFIWIDGDVVVNHNIDTVRQYFNKVGRYPLSDIHVQEEFFGTWDNGSQLFNEQLANEWGIRKSNPYMHICFYIYNKGSEEWFNEILKHYTDIIKNNPSDYKRLYLWNDEGIDNAMRWKYGYRNYLPISNFDTSSYDGDEGFIDKTLHQFYKFWNEEGPQNFDRIFGYQFIPKDKSQIIYFHGNKNAEISDKMIEFIKMQRDNSFYKSMCFYTDVYKLENYESLFEYQGATMHVAEKFGWAPAIFHEIYNLRDYYANRVKRINEGDIVVDLGGNMGMFNRWAYSEGASKVISFEPDRRYFKLLSLNADPRSVLFNAAAAHEVGELNLYESEHLGGSNVFGINGVEGYTVKTYTLNYLFESGLVDKIDFLKIDIEGAEHAALKGISDENLMKVKSIGMEYHHAHFNFDEDLRQTVIDRMIGLGFNSYLSYTATDNLQMLYFERKVKSNRTSNIHFVDGPFAEVNEDANHQYNVQFIDGDTGKIVYETNIKSNHWTKASKKYKVNWIVKIKGIGNDFYREEKFNPEGQRIMICFESKSLGDSLAWIPYVEEFRVKNNCHVICSTFKNDLFKGQYPEIEFVEPGKGVNNIYALFRLGLFQDDERKIKYDKHPSNPRIEPLGKMATDILGLEFEEIRAKLPKFSKKKAKRVCIAIHSTAQAKYWNNPTGWQQVVTHLKKKGYEVRLLSREEDGYMGNKNPQGVKQQKPGPLEKVIEVLEESELFIGIGSGLSWLAWSVGIPCIIISGFSEEYSEPMSGVSRLINKDVCHGCWNVYDFNPGDWNWCPVHKGTKQQFECSKSIKGDDVIKEIEKLLSVS